MKYICVFLAVFMLNATPLFAAEFPSCVQISSDLDGDGFGYENSQTCVVDDSTSFVAVPGPCIDDNADGFGWNGVATCEVEVVENPECVDTTPIGDGWGWNGRTSCRVVPRDEFPEPELEVLKDNLLDVVPQGTQHHTVIFCPAAAESYTLRIDGRLDYFIGTDFQAAGMWSTGMFDRDQTLHIFLQNGFSSMEILDSETVRFQGEVCFFF